MTTSPLADLTTAHAAHPDSCATVIVNKTQRSLTPNQISALLNARPVPEDEYLLEVPYFSQESGDAKRYKNDCGPASIKMLLAYYGLPDATVDALSYETGLRTADVGLTTQAIVNLGNAHGLKLAVTTQANPGFVRSEIAAGRPVIPLISYAPLVNRLNTADISGHFLVVIGYDAESYYVNDPDWYTKGNKTAEDGHHWRIPKDQFEKALQVSPVPYQAAIIAPQVLPDTNYAQGLDLSHYQTITDMALLRKSYDFIILKATQGLKWNDTNFAAWRSALQGGPRLGAYHFGTGSDPVKQAEHFVNIVKPDGNIALWLDFERNPDTSATSEGSMTATQADIFIDTVERLTGKVCGIYTRANLVPAGNWRFKRVPLWVASYNVSPTIPPLWDTWSIQQYNNGATGPTPYAAQGIAANCDHDRFNGDADAMSVFWPTISGTVLVAPPPPPPQWATRYVDSPFRLGLNIHTEPGLNTPVLSGNGYPNGTRVYVNTASLTNGYVQDDRGGWIAWQYLSATAPNVIPPLRTLSLVGLHSYGNGGYTVIDIAKELNDAGTPLAAVEILCQAGWDQQPRPSQVKAVSPSTIVVERWVTGDSAWDAAKLLDDAGIKWSWDMGDMYDIGWKAVELYAAHYPIDPATDYVQIMNEQVVVNTLSTTSFWRGGMDKAKKLNIKLAVMSTPYFWPALPGETHEGRSDLADPSFWTSPLTADMARQIIRDGHILCAHEYIYHEPDGPWDKSPMGRFAQGINLLPIDCRAVPVLLNEYGTYSGGAQNGDTYISRVYTGEKFARTWKINLKGLVLWVVGPYMYQDVSSDISGHRAQIANYVKTKRF